MADPKPGEYRSSIIFNREQVNKLRENDYSISAFVRNSITKKYYELIRKESGEPIEDNSNKSTEQLNNRIAALNTQTRQQIQLMEVVTKEKIFWRELCEKFVKDLDLNEKEMEIVKKWLN